MSTLLRDRLVIDTGRRLIDRPLDGLGHARMRVDLAGVRAGAPNDDGSIPFGGHAAVFGRQAWIGSKRYGWWEQVRAGAFAKTIGEADVRLLINHDPNLLLARNKAGTLRLSEDDTGLRTDADMAPVSYAQDLAVLLERGDISQMSFAFDVIGYEVSVADDGKDLLELTELRLWDVSVVTYPAYEATDAGLRAAGFDRLAERLGLDDQARQRVLAGDEFDLPASRGADPGPAETTQSEEGPPAEPTGDSHKQLRLATLAAQTRLNGRRIHGNAS